ncbi:serine-rich adhesin for platelets [Periplaneta americana]|uniref:serine-rich adhesin for platelets n=1 Tax=Periplaneta americana TaxID=6978 RepID=UPI0037E71B71
MLEELYEDNLIGDPNDLEEIIENQAEEQYEGGLAEAEEEETENNANNENAAENENETSGTRVDPKKKRIVRNPQPKLNPERLKGPRGIAVLEKTFEDFKFHGKGHEKGDLNRVMKQLEHWAHRLFPRFQFDDCLEKIEKLGQKKPMQVYVKKIRMGMETIDEPMILNEDADEPENLHEVQDEAPIDAFDELLSQQLSQTRTENQMQTTLPVPTTPLPQQASAAIQSFELTAEQRERMLKNRLLAEERRLARMKAKHDMENAKKEQQPSGDTSLTSVPNVSHDPVMPNESHSNANSGNVQTSPSSITNMSHDPVVADESHSNASCSNMEILEEMDVEKEQPSDDINLTSGINVTTPAEPHSDYCENGQTLGEMDIGKEHSFCGTSLASETNISQDVTASVQPDSNAKESSIQTLKEMGAEKVALDHTHLISVTDVSTSSGSSSETLKKIDIEKEQSSDDTNLTSGSNVTTSAEPHFDSYENGQTLEEMDIGKEHSLCGTSLAPETNISQDVTASVQSDSNAKENSIQTRKEMGAEKEPLDHTHLISVTDVTTSSKSHSGAIDSKQTIKEIDTEKKQSLDNTSLTSVTNISHGATASAESDCNSKDITVPTPRKTNNDVKNITSSTTSHSNANDSSQTMKGKERFLNGTILPSVTNSSDSATALVQSDSDTKDSRIQTLKQTNSSAEQNMISVANQSENIHIILGVSDRTAFQSELVKANKTKMTETAVSGFTGTSKFEDTNMVGNVPEIAEAVTNVSSPKSSTVKVDNSSPMLVDDTEEITLCTKPDSVAVNNTAVQMDAMEIDSPSVPCDESLTSQTD